MKNSFLMALAMLAMHDTLLTSAVGGGQINTCSNVCAGNNVACRDSHANCGGTMSTDKITTKNTVNAYGDRINWGSIDKLQKQQGFLFADLGTWKSIKNYTLSFPAVNTKKVIQLIPTEGNYAHQTMQILFVTFDLHNLPAELNNEEFKLVRKDLNNFKNSPFRYIIKIYRRAGKEVDWVEIGGRNANEILTNSAPSSLKVSLRITPKAVIIVPSMDQRRADGTVFRTKEQIIDCGLMF